MKILFINSGASGFHQRYALDIYATLLDSFNAVVRHINPSELSYSLIREFRPDLLLVVHGTRTPLRMIRHAREVGAITVLWLVEDPYEIDHHRGSMVKTYDYVFTNERLAVKEYLHPRASYLPWCCNPLLHKQEKVSSFYQSDLCFVGMGFPNRVKTLNAIAPFLKKYRVRLVGEWGRWSEPHPDLKKFILPVAHDLRRVLKYYNGARINLNIHRDPIDPPSGNSRGVQATSPNDRAFILAGCGALQMVDNTRPDLWSCFKEGEEVIGFSDPDDLARKIEFYLKRPAVCEKIGKAAQIRAYQEHTYKHRLAEIFRLINRLAKKAGYFELLPELSRPIGKVAVVKGETWSFPGLGWQ